jgi:transposase, IS5 family
MTHFGVEQILQLDHVISLGKAAGSCPVRRAMRRSRRAWRNGVRKRPCKQLPYEFGVKVSVATTVKHSAGGQFAAALPGNPYDGHTLSTVIPQMQALIGNILNRCITDAGYRGHNAPPDYKFKIYTSGQKRRVTPQIKREFKRRAAIEPVIGHLKEHHRMGRNHLAHASGDAINAVLAAAGYNFRRLLAWLRLLLLRILIVLSLPAELKSV